VQPKRCPSVRPEREGIAFQMNINDYAEIVNEAHNPARPKH